MLGLLEVHDDSGALVAEVDQALRDHGLDG